MRLHPDLAVKCFTPQRQRATINNREADRRPPSAAESSIPSNTNPRVRNVLSEDEPVRADWTGPRGPRHTSPIARLAGPKAVMRPRDGSMRSAVARDDEAPIEKGQHLEEHCRDHPLRGGPAEGGSRILEEKLMK